MKRIVCYGDSNTYGYDAADIFGGRLPPDQRWTNLLSKMLQCVVVNCGMNGRTVPRYPRSIENDLCLIKRSFPCDFLIVMLGSNDILTERDLEDTAEAMARFLTRLKADISSDEIILCSPPQVSGLGEAFSQRISELSGLYAILSQELGIHFCDVASWLPDLAADGVHFSPEGHRFFAERMSVELMRIQKKA